MQKDTEELAYMVYSSDALKVTTENTRRFNGGYVMEKRFADMIDIGVPKDERSGEEIAEDIILRAGLNRGIEE